MALAKPNTEQSILGFLTIFRQGIRQGMKMQQLLVFDLYIGPKQLLHKG
jgi:hypothetical protein